MNARVLVAAVTAAVIVTLTSAAAWARNPHCSGGIQYLTQANADKLKGNIEDYQREIGKAVAQLEQCSSEDPKDYEAAAYLGWAYCQVDSFRAAGKAFQAAIDGLSTQSDKKKLDFAVTNRKSYWAEQFNKGINSINAAQNADGADKAKQFDDAIGRLNNALYLIPNDPTTLRNMGTVYALRGDYVTAEKYFVEGKSAAKDDTTFDVAIKQARTGRAGQLLDDKKYDEAIAYYQGLLKTDPNNGDLWAGVGDAMMTKARSADSASRSAQYCQAGEALAKAGQLKPGTFELPFNAAICYRNCGKLAESEAQWASALAIKGDDRDALMNASSVLAEDKKYPDAIKYAMRAVALDPKDKDGHQILGNVYYKAGDTPHSRQFTMAFLALRSGKPADAPTAASGAAGTKLQASAGKPDQILLWEADSQAYESWFYWAKGQAYHFTGGAQLEKTDWSAALAAK